MNAYRSRPTIFTALCASLILHLLILIFFLYIKFDKINNVAKNDNNVFLKKKKKNSIKWAAHKARACQFGAPVIFKDEPEETGEEQKNKSDPKDQETLNTQQLVQATKKEPPIQKQETSFPEKQKEELKKTVPLDKNPVNEYLSKSANTKQPNQKPPKPVKPPQSVSLPQKPLTLAQLTKGFLEHIKDEGKHRTTTIGQKGQTPTAEQLKHERYVEKLSWCLQNSFKINNDKFPTTEPVKTIVKVYLALNQNGTVKELKIIESSGNTLLDQFVHYIFRDASSSFPPVPHYFSHNPYIITYIIEIDPIHNTRVGFHLL